MKLYIRQKVFSLTHRFTIKDETGIDRYTVEGEPFSFRHRMRLYNQQGQEVAFIQRRPWSFLPRFDVYIGGRLRWKWSGSLPSCGHATTYEG